MDFIPTADAVIYPQNQPSTVQVWERLKSQPKKWYIPNGEDRNVSYSPNAIYWPEEKSESYRIEEQLNFWPNKVSIFTSISDTIYQVNILNSAQHSF